MSRKLVLGGSVGIVCLLGFLLLVSSPVRADRPMGVWSLDGTYDFTWVEIRWEGSVLDYCSGWGFGVFDGAGNATMTGTHRCSVTETGTDTWDHTYTVAPDGQAWFTEVGQTYSVHALVLQKGKMILTDATTVTSASGVLVHHAVGVKR